MLAVRDVAKAFGARRALGGVTLYVAAGDAVLLVGRNGAGKTTLLRIVTGYLDPDAGEVAIDGIALSRDRAGAQARLGYLPEHAPAPPDLTVREHLILRAGQKGLGAGARQAVDKAAAAAAVERELSRRIGTLSKGYRQRVGLADALLGERPLLVLDEPTSGMDPIQVTQLRRHLVAAARERAVLVSSHAVADLEDLATHVAVLRDGELVAFDTPSALCEQAKVKRLDDAVRTFLDEGDAA
ncbi:MAG: ABC transporter ATP-binding protein [Deltaproteobacteria bacterium]|nr:ABC transporter ATP-binding protein [Deltaproteobacteria bacterium]